MKSQYGECTVRFCVLFSLALVLVLGMPANAHAMAPAQCTPGSCDDNNVCTTDTCDPVQGCIYTPVNCDDGNVCTVNTGFILAGTFEGDVYKINTSNGAYTLMFSTGQSFIGVTYDGTYIWTTGGYTSNLVHKRDLAGNVLATFNTGQMNAAIGYDPDDGTLWIGHLNGQVTHRSQSGTLLGGFSTAAGGQIVDGLELANMPLAP